MITEQPVPMQGTLFDVENNQTDPQVGYRGPSVCQIAGITYCHLDYWTRTDLVAVSVTAAADSGSQRLYSFRDILLSKIIKSLLDTEISLQNVRKALPHLADRGVADLSGLKLMSDVTTVYECTLADEIVDLLAGVQGVFGVAVPGLVTELSGTVTAFSFQRSNNPASFDEPEDRHASRRLA